MFKRTLLYALINPYRLKILDYLLHEEDTATFGEIYNQFRDISKPTISHHIKVLVNEGFLKEEMEGTYHLYQLKSEKREHVRALLLALHDLEEKQ